MLVCKEAAQLISRGLDRKLALRERVALRLHLLMCKGCRNFSAQMGFLRRAFRQRSALADEQDRD